MKAYQRGPGEYVRFLWNYYRLWLIAATVIAAVFGFTVVFTFVTLWERMR